MTRRSGDFRDTTRRQLAERVGYVCAYPACRLLTLAATQGQPGAMTLGWASHKVAAGTAGPRPASEHGDYTNEQLRCADNGIWLCVRHAVIVDRDPNVHSVDLLTKWQQDAEGRASMAARYGRSMDVPVSPHIVSPRALAFFRAVRDTLPGVLLRYMPDIRVEHLRRIETFLQQIHPFIPTHDLHGIEPELVAVQHQIIADLRTFVNFVKRPDIFWRDTDHDAYIPHDRDEFGPTVAYGDGLFQRVSWMNQRIAEVWGQGQGYYPAR